MPKINESKKRSLLKGLTAKILEIIFDMIVLMLFGVESHLSFGLAVLFEVVCFMLGFINDRIWNLTDWERKVKTEKDGGE